MWPFKGKTKKFKTAVDEEVETLIQKTNDNIIVWKKCPRAFHKHYSASYNSIDLYFGDDPDRCKLSVNGMLLTDSGLVFKLRTAIEKQIAKHNKQKDIDAQQKAVLTLKNTREN